jgi:Right handed beta helix region
MLRGIKGDAPMCTNRRTLSSSLLVLLLALPGIASAGIVIVPDNAPTINAAMALISECDLILVRAGVYVEEISTGAHPLCFTLASESGPESTIIVGGVLTPHHEGSFTVTIDCFTIRDGVGISMSSGTPNNRVTIRNCVIVDNSRLGTGVPDGGGIHLRAFGSSPFPTNDPQIRIENCVIRGNQGARGGGIWISHEARITNCIITDNLATGAGGGIYYDPSIARRFVQKSTIARNQSTGGGAGIHCLTNGSRTFAVQNVIVAMNQGGNGIFADGNPDSVRVTCSDAWDNSAGNYIGFPDPTGTAGNLSVDPLFCAPEVGDYRLQVGSPCANAPGCGRIGGLGLGCGVVGIDEASPHLAALRLAPNPSAASITIELGSGTGEHAVLLVRRPRPAGGPARPAITESGTGDMDLATSGSGAAARRGLLLPGRGSRIARGDRTGSAPRSLSRSCPRLDTPGGCT